MMTKEIFNTMQSQVIFYLNNFDDEIKKIKKLQYDCLSDEDLNSLVYATELMSDYDKTKAINRLRNRLISIQNSSIYIQDVSAYIPSINRAINASTTGKGSIEEITDETYLILKKIPLDSESQILYWNNRLVLVVVSPFQDKKNVPPSFFIEVVLSKNALRNTLVESDTSLGVRSIMESLTQKFVITSDNDEKASNQLLKIVGKYHENKKNDTISVKADGKKYLLIYASSDYLGTIISRYIPEDMIFKPLKKYRVWYWAFSILAVIIIVFYSFSTYRFIQKPILKMIKSFRKVEKGDFNIKIMHEQKNEFRYLYACFNEMVLNIKKLIDQVYNQKILTQKAEFKQLQSQINPHFLYNSFFILQRRINKGDYENAEKFCEGLGIYFKFITRSGSEEVTLAKEVEHARIYAEIQASRFSNRIRVDFGSVPSDCENLIVPRLILQPIIENAFEHGLEEKEQNGLLQISFFKLDNILTITIQDNGEGVKNSELDELRKVLNGDKENTENTGIINIHKRIRLALGDNSGINASHGELGGLKIEIHLEIKEEH